MTVPAIQIMTGQTLQMSRSIPIQKGNIYQIKLIKKILNFSL